MLNKYYFTIALYNCLFVSCSETRYVIVTMELFHIADTQSVYEYLLS